MTVDKVACGSQSSGSVMINREICENISRCERRAGKMLRFFRKRKRKLPMSLWATNVAAGDADEGNKPNNLPPPTTEPSMRIKTTHSSIIAINNNNDDFCLTNARAIPIVCIILLISQILQVSTTTTTRNFSNLRSNSKLIGGFNVSNRIQPEFGDGQNEATPSFSSSGLFHPPDPNPLPIQAKRATAADPIIAANKREQGAQFAAQLRAGRCKRAASGSKADQSQPAADSTTQLVAVSGQWVELKCPLAGELMLASSSQAPTTSSRQQPEQAVLWRRNGVSLSQLDPRYRLAAANGSLVIAGAQVKLDEGDYECAIGRPSASQPAASSGQWPSAGGGARIHRFRLRLLVPPRLAPFEFAHDAQVGMKLVVTCSALEGQQPISFVWLKDNQIIWADQDEAKQRSTKAANSLNQIHGQQLADKLALAAPSGHRISGATFEADVGADGKAETGEQLPLPLLSDQNVRVRQSDDYSILSIERLELKHSGRYTCSAQNEAARSSHSSQLLINAPPSLTIEPKDGDLVSGHSSVIDCAASGQPRPTVSWLRARESSDRHWDYVPVYDNLRYTSLANGSLAIANVTQREQGYYLCSAKNGFGPEVTKLIKITVHEPAKLSSKYQTVEVRIDERANMVCAASGELPIAFEWLDKDGNSIQRNDKRFIIDQDSQDTGSGHEDESAANKSVSRLMLTRSGRADSGHYTCQASNKHGSDKMAINLLVQDVPDKVTELKVTNVTASTISVRWQLAFNGNSPITSYLVQYQSDDPLDDLLAASPNILSNPPRGHQSQVGAASTQRPPPTSSNLATGGAEAPPQQSDTFAAQSPTSALRAALDALNIVSSWENADEAIDRTLVELTVEQSSTHLVVKDLSPYCVYRLRLAGINKIGLGEFSDWIRAKTEEAAPSGSASKIAATATGPNSIKVTWSPPDRRSWNGQLIGFNIGYRPIDSGFELNKTIEWSPPTFKSIMLDTDTKQRSLVTSATSGSGAKQAAESDPFVGSAAAADPMSQQKRRTGHNLEQQQQSTDQATGGGQPEAQQQAGTSQYILRQHLRQLLALQQQELVAHLTNLQRSTTYLVWMQAVNQRGFGPQSHAISIKTLDDVPPSAPAIKVQSTSQNSITLAWSMLSNFVSPANQYSIFYRRIPQQLQQQFSANGPTPTGLSNSSSSSSSSSLFMSHHHLDFAPPDPYLASNPAISGHQLVPGPFIERTLSSQQLMIGSPGGFAMDAQHDPTMLVLDQQPVKPSFMHQQQTQNLYQQFVYTLDQLECGSVYELYMTTRNSVGKSEPSPTVTTRTMGEPPLAPANKNNLFAKIGANEVALNLAAWSTGGCPITHATARYKQVSSGGGHQMLLVSQNHSSSSSNSATGASAQQPLSLGWPITTNVPASTLAAVNALHLQPLGPPAGQAKLGHSASANEPPNTIHQLKSLLPSTAYELEVTAHNAAGHTSAQYEFVTANANGTRAGFSRKEGVYRMDQRGLPLEQPPSPLPADGGHRPMEQPASFTNQTGAGGQLLPLILMLLCFVCLIVSSVFCYNRLTDSWKRSPRRPPSTDPSRLNFGQRGHEASSSSPMSKSSIVWRLTNQTNLLANGGHSSRHHHGGLGPKQAGAGRPRDDLSSLPGEPHDSPSTVAHYCMREPVSSEVQLSTSLEPKGPCSSFSQSVSMKDFNLALQAAAQPSVNAPRAIRGVSSTLNFRGPRQRSQLMDGTATKMAGTLRHSRLFSDSLPFEDSDHQQQQQMCQSVYTNGTLNNCKQKQSMGQSLEAAYAPVNHGATFGAVATNGAQQCDNLHHQFSYTTSDGQQQQETSWTNYGLGQQQQHPTGYAIPAAAAATNTNYNDPLGPYDLNQQQLQQDYVRQDNYNQSSIDACIQQLMSQQYQQQDLNQQQYAVIINQKTNNLEPANNKCPYGNDGFSGSLQQNIAVQQTGLGLVSQNNGAQSMIDSSSSSSGIDVGHHLECGSSTATGTSNSNASNNCYQLTQANCEQDYGKREQQQQQQHPIMARPLHEIDLKQL